MCKLVFFLFKKKLSNQEDQTSYLTLLFSSICPVYALHGSTIQTGDLNKPIKNTGPVTDVSLGTAQQRGEFSPNCMLLWKCILFYNTQTKKTLQTDYYTMMPENNRYQNLSFLQTSSSTTQHPARQYSQSTAETVQMLYIQQISNYCHGNDSLQLITLYGLDLKCF